MVKDIENGEPDPVAMKQPAAQQACKVVPGQDSGDRCHSQRRRPQFFKDYWHNLKERPLFMLLPPLVVFCVLCALSILGAVLGANKYEAEARARAESAALDWAASFRLSTEKIFTPLVTLSILIQQNPQLAAINGSFPKVAQQLLESVNSERTVIQELQVSPMGVIEMIYPKNNDTDTRLGINIFNQSALRGGALKTIEARELIMNGPLKLVMGNYGTIARIPIFIDNSTLEEDFGTGRNLPYNCTDLCFNSTTKEKFWGFATAIGPLDDLRAGNDSRLDLLKHKGYKYLMTRPYTATERNDSKLYRPEWTDRHDQYVFANSSSWPSGEAVGSDINIGNAVWRVYLEPWDGWRPGWEQGVIAAVVLGNVLVAGLVGLIVASWAQQQRLLDDVMESNVQLAEATGKLQEEKLRLDALLVRQYNLLAVLGGNRARGVGADGLPANININNNDNTGSSPDTSIGSKEGLTLDRIESMRRQLAVNSNTSLQDLESIQTLELLGEGTFGKVYKGLWRGTTVAVKTMLLPSNMSGAEKREKMAVMEAAISSSLSHPNVVQTYTYAIRPMRDVTGAMNIGDTSEVGRNDFTTVASRSMRTGDSTATGSIHSYEVRLVLEFCDKGCLRDALDDGIFSLGVAGVNYLAILETAADVAKAMLHLHSLNVLHSDLKARNVMLATGNADGRGVVGKVGDFGLSLKMDHMETHISQVYAGTMSHMAPEIMLEGRVSKAADVYAFGITLWELYTAERAFDGVPRALLGHAITREQLRPRFPDGTPKAYKELAERCWHTSWERRPTFDELLQELLSMRAADPRRTPPLKITPRTYMPPGTMAAGPPGGMAGSGLPGGRSGSATTGTASSGGSGGPLSREPSSSPLPSQQLRVPSTPLAGMSLPAFGTSSGAGALIGVGDRSFYVDGSLDESHSELLIMSDWSHGASGIGSSARSLLQRSRPLAMPQIDEAAEQQQQSSGQLPVLSQKLMTVGEQHSTASSEDSLRGQLEQQLQQLEGRQQQQQQQQQQLREQQQQQQQQSPKVKQEQEGQVEQVSDEGGG